MACQVHYGDECVNGLGRCFSPNSRGEGRRCYEEARQCAVAQ